MADGGAVAVIRFCFHLLCLIELLLKLLRYSRSNPFRLKKDNSFPAFLHPIRYHRSKKIRDNFYLDEQCRLPHGGW
jgi:hypothetical protein